MSATIATGSPARRLSPAQLRERWLRMIEDPLLARIPFKLELNERGAIEVTPATTRHAFLQAFVAKELGTLRPEGSTFTECPIETAIGVRVPDVAWASPEFMARHGMPTPLPNAPDLCIEILSPSSSRVEMDEKVAAYLAAGAREIWLVGEDGDMQIFSEHGLASSSLLGIEIELPR